MEIKALANKVKRKYKGKIGIKEITSELESHGYNVVFFHTPEGDKLLEAYGLSTCRESAFTYCGKTKIVFVDNALHSDDKICVLLHELGHILLGHIGNGNAKHQNVTMSEIEADAFVYEMQQPSHAPKMAMGILVLLLALTLFVGTAFYSQCPKRASPALESENTYSAEVSTDADAYVYLTGSGSKYHRFGCIYTKDKNCAALKPEEAKKCFAPCAVCNPVQ